MFLKRFLKSIFSSNISFTTPIFVDNKENMESMVSELESENILAIDTEFDWRTTYHPKISLIQIASKDLHLSY